MCVPARGEDDLRRSQLLQHLDALEARRKRMVHLEEDDTQTVHVRFGMVARLALGRLHLRGDVQPRPDVQRHITLPALLYFFFVTFFFFGDWVLLVLLALTFEEALLLRFDFCFLLGCSLVWVFRLCCFPEEADLSVLLDCCLWRLGLTDLDFFFWRL